MPDPTKQDAADKAKSQEQTFAEAAKRVQRKVVEFADVKGEDGKPVLKTVGEVFKDHGDAYADQCKM